ncbi:MAG: nucleotide sugar dehydrogenase [Anaerolineae bacterium]|nr:nucleotide sugar dehydrogenase [Anaerolineae bacterium]
MNNSTTFKNVLRNKIDSRNARIAVIGLGYVGLPLAVEFAKAGFCTIGIDNDERKVEALSAGQSYIDDVPEAEIQALVKTGQLKATTDYRALADCDAISICVPTPLSKTHDPELSYVISAADAVAKYIHSGMLIVLESTTYPGTTEEVIVPRMFQNGLQVGRDVFVAFSPERIDPGRTDYMLKNTPKVIGGMTPACSEMVQRLYSCIVERVVPVSSSAAAEMVKLLENTFRAVNIAMVNEFLMMCDKLGLDAHEIIEAAATKPFGFTKFTPGPGVGGHCIPLDPHYLSWKLRTLNYNARFIQLASEINTGMPAYWVARATDLLNEAGRSVKGSQVLVLGVSYKPNVDDTRESPALDIIRLLEARGAFVSFHDPFVGSLYSEGLETPRIELTDITLAATDCVLIATNHKNYDWAWVRQHAGLIVDTCYALGPMVASRYFPAEEIRL